MTTEALRWPLIIAVVVIVIRIALELLAMPMALTMIFGVTWLYLLVPVYFAFMVAAKPQPYRDLLKLAVVFALITRLMIAFTYLLAFIFQWSAPRFQVANGGVVGEGVTAAGLVGTLFLNFLIGTIFTALVMLIIGAIAIAILRRRKLTETTAT